MEASLKKGWLALLLLALCWQGILAQTHLHLPPKADISLGHASAGAAPTLSLHRHNAPDDAAACPVCRALAHAQALLLPPAPAVAATLAGLLWLAPLPLDRLVILPQPRPWQSRAPPEQLQPR